jgi:uracil-DNA glycosylase
MTRTDLAESIPTSWQLVIPELGAVAENIAQQLADVDDVRPARGLWFAALRSVSPQQLSVVILGQDPYHGEDHGMQQAHGLGFSVPHGVRPPPSLKNILTELQADVGSNNATSGNLSHWCTQGVLLLNTALTTHAGVAGAHKKIWAQFTKLLLGYLGRQSRPLVFILWGADAQKYKVLIGPQHVVIESAHPSPLSSYRGFFGSRPFSQCNAALVAIGRSAIDWS